MWNEIKSLYQKKGSLGFLWQEDKSDLFKACMLHELKMICGKSKDFRFRRQIFNRFFLSYLLLNLLGIPQPWCLAISPKASTETPRQEIGTFEQAPGRTAAALQIQRETERSLRKHQEQSVPSTSFLYPRKFMTTPEVLSIHSLEPFLENMKGILDPWALPGFAHFFKTHPGETFHFPLSGQWSQ